jgi:nucleoside-diphosphate-sugar epimerase
MPTIAIVGANGQVGSEIALLLAQIADVEVVPIVRSEYGGSYLRRAGLSVRVGSVSREDDTQRLLEGVDVVADFSLPGGLPAAIRKGIEGNVRACMAHAPKHAAYVFMSSTMAFGMPGGSAYAEHTLARTPYAAQKRFGERLTQTLGARHGRPAFSFRLGQVHGELQGVSREVAALVRAGRPIALPARGEVPSDVVFCRTIAHALLHVARGLERPGRYTLVERPDWTLAQAYQHYARDAGVPLNLLDSGNPARPRDVSLAQRAVAAGRALVAANRSLLVAQVLPWIPGIELGAKMRHLDARARSDADLGRLAGAASPLHFLGPVPGERLASLTDTRVALEREELALRTLLHARFGPRGHVFQSGL